MLNDVDHLQWRINEVRWQTRCAIEVGSVPSSEELLSCRRATGICCLFINSQQDPEMAYLYGLNDEFGSQFGQFIFDGAFITILPSHTGFPWGYTAIPSPHIFPSTILSLIIALNLMTSSIYYSGVPQFCRGQYCCLRSI